MPISSSTTCVKVLCQALLAVSCFFAPGIDFGVPGSRQGWVRTLLKKHQGEHLRSLVSLRVYIDMSMCVPPPSYRHPLYMMWKCLRDACVWDAGMQSCDVSMLARCAFKVEQLDSVCGGAAFAGAKVRRGGGASFVFPHSPPFDLLHCERITMTPVGQGGHETREQGGEEGGTYQLRLVRGTTLTVVHVTALYRASCVRYGALPSQSCTLRRPTMPVASVTVHYLRNRARYGALPYQLRPLRCTTLTVVHVTAF